MADSILPTVSSNVTAAINNSTAASSSSSATGVDKTTLAGNFQTFLTLLTTQLKNQNPLDPLDTNQFTQQLVQFAQVEQQLKQNEQLATLVSLEKTAQATTALAYVGQTVAVNGQTAYTGSFTINTGTQNFTWDGRDNNGVQWPDGNYTMSVTAKDASGQSVSIASEVQGVVDSVDVTQSPPVLSIGGQTFTLDKIKRVVRPAA